MNVTFFDAKWRALVTLVESANYIKPNILLPFLFGYFLALLILASRTIPHLYVI